MGGIHLTQVADVVAALDKEFQCCGVSREIQRTTEEEWIRLLTIHWSSLQVLLETEGVENRRHTDSPS